MVRPSVVVLLAVVAVASVAAVGPSGAVETGRVTGAALELSEAAEERWLQRMNKLVREFDVEKRSRAVRLETKAGSWIVYRNGPPSDDWITAEGTLIRPDETTVGNDTGYVFATSIDRRRPLRTNVSALRNDTGAFAYKEVRLRTRFRQLGYRGGANLTKRRAGGVLASRFADDDFLLPPGRAARRGIVALSRSAGDSRADRVHRLAAPAAPGANTTDALRNQFWIDDRTRVNALVLTRSSTLRLRIVEASVGTQSIDGPSVIDRRGEELAGEVVTFEARGVGRRSSVTRLLRNRSADRCRDDRVVTAAGCLRPAVDVTLHSGVLFADRPDERDGAVAYVGLSNRRQSDLATAREGVVRVTGRVVAADRIHPSLRDEYALLVYDLERRGDLNLGRRASDRRALERARGWGHNVTTAMWRQANTTIESPTPTATPPPAATPTPLPTITLTPTASPTLSPSPAPTSTASPVPPAPTLSPTASPTPTASSSPSPTATGSPGFGVVAALLALLVAALARRR